MRIRIKLKKVRFLIPIAIFLAVIIVYLILDSSIKPTIFEISEARLSSMAVSAMNEAVVAVAKDVSYEDLVTIKTDATGQVTLLQANSLKMNELASQISTRVQNYIAALGKIGISIPVGTIIGGQLFSGKGPLIKILFEPVGSVTSSFASEFETAGINQTRHKILLVMDTSLRIVIGNSSQRVKVTTQVLISETIIIGKVPDTYLSGTRDEILNLVPTS